MPIDPLTLRKSLATSRAWAEAIYKGMNDWKRHGGDSIRQKVVGIEAPTFDGGNPQIVDGCCLSEHFTPPEIKGIEDLMKRQKNLAAYLKFLAEHV